MDLHVHTSTVADGSLYNRHDPKDAEVISNRKKFLAGQSISIDKSVRLNLNFDGDDFCRYTAVDSTHKGKGMQGGDIFYADALITTQQDVALFLPVADCIGAVIYDPVKGVLALAHLGRHSLEQHGGQKIIEHIMHSYGSNAADLELWLTPAAGKEVYPIWKLDHKGMKEAAFEQFAAAGISSSQIHDNQAETTADPDYFSYSEFLKGNQAVDGDHAIVAVLR
jgi:copper oxidase (laccase) domain-containing protein